MKHIFAKNVAKFNSELNRVFLSIAALHLAKETCSLLMLFSITVVAAHFATELIMWLTEPDCIVIIDDLWDYDTQLTMYEEITSSALNRINGFPSHYAESPRDTNKSPRRITNISEFRVCSFWCG